MTSLSCGGEEDPSTPDQGTAPLLPGYQIIEPLGSGGMGSVWKAKQLATQRLVALKLISGQAFQAERVRARFIREVELAARLDHPNIAHVYDSGVDHGVYYYSMRLIEGDHLDRYVRSHDLSVADRLNLFLQVCDAVAFAHRNGVIHRDLKPSNILVGDDGVPYLVDFGLARAADVDGPLPAMSQDGEMAGTLEYMAPEQAAGDLSAMDVQCDVYSLGAILFQLLTGKLPHDQSGTAYERRKRLIEQEPRRASATGTDIHPDLEAVLAKAIARDRPERYATVEEFARDLRAYLSSEPVTARQLTISYFMLRWAGRHRLRLTVAVMLSIALIAGAVYAYGWWSAQKSRAEAEARHARHSQYINQIISANKALEAGNTKRAAQLLSRTPPEERGWEWRWLTHASDCSVFSAQLPDRSSTAIHFTKGGRQITAILADGRRLAWDVASGTRVQDASARAMDADSAWIAANHPTVVFGSSTGELTAWNTESDTRATVMAGLYGTARNPIVSPSGRHLAWADADGRLCIWNTRSSELGVYPDTHVKPLAISSQTSTLVGRADLSMYIARWEGGRLSTTTVQTESPVADAAFSPNGDTLAICRQGNRGIELWSLTAAGDVKPSRHMDRERNIRIPTFSPDGALIAARTEDANIKVWDVETGQLVALCTGNWSTPMALKFDESGRYLASVAWDTYLKVYDLRHTALPRRVWSEPGLTVTSADVAADTGTVVLGCADGTVRLIQPDQDHAVELSGRHSSEVRDVDVDASGQTIVSTSGRAVLLHRVGQGHQRIATADHVRQLVQARLDSSGTRIAITKATGIEIHHIANANKTNITGNWGRCIWTPDDEALWAGKQQIDNDHISIAQIRLPDVLKKTMGSVPLANLCVMTTSSDAGTLALSSSQGRVALWNTEQQAVTTLIDAQTEPPGYVRCQFDGIASRLLTSGRAVKLWDTRSGLELLHLHSRHHDGPFVCAAFTNNGRAVTAVLGAVVLQWAPQARF